METTEPPHEFKPVGAIAFMVSLFSLFILIWVSVYGLMLLRTPSAPTPSAEAAHETAR